jgi:hypothetical protein
MAPRRRPAHMDRDHAGMRNALRVVGPVVLLVGIGFTLTGVLSFFSAFGNSSRGLEPPENFWCAFVGMPLVAIGSLICKFAFLGAVARYAANEVAPVGTDVVNYMADGTKDAIRDVAAAVGEGLRSEGSSTPELVVRCKECDTDNDESAAFCDNCGKPLSRPKQCACGKLNDQDARFCDSCGASLV